MVGPGGTDAIDVVQFRPHKSTEKNKATYPPQHKTRSNFLKQRAAMLCYSWLDLNLCNTAQLVKTVTMSQYCNEKLKKKVSKSTTVFMTQFSCSTQIKLQNKPLKRLASWKLLPTLPPSITPKKMFKSLTGERRPNLCTVQCHFKMRKNRQKPRSKIWFWC